MLVELLVMAALQSTPAQATKTAPTINHKCYSGLEALRKDNHIKRINRQDGTVTFNDGSVIHATTVACVTDKGKKGFMIPPPPKPPTAVQVVR